MLINPLMRTRKPRQFEYQPRHYDPDKESREARKREVLGDDYQKAYEQNEDSQERKPGEAIRLRRGILAERQRTAQHKNRSNITRLLIVLMLLILFILWLYS